MRMADPMTISAKMTTAALTASDVCGSMVTPLSYEDLGGQHPKLASRPCIVPLGAKPVNYMAWPPRTYQGVIS